MREPNNGRITCGTCKYNHYSCREGHFTCDNDDSEYYGLETDYDDYCIDAEEKD